MVYSKLASRIINDIRSGLRGYHSSMSLPIEQIEDEIVSVRLSIIKEYIHKGLISPSDFMLSINCVPVDCKDIAKCSKCSQFKGELTMHFEIPQIITDFGENAIQYVGSIDKQNQFLWYTTPYSWKLYHKYRKRGRNRPYVYIDPTPNENNMLDCFVFNAPLLKMVSVIAAFKDPSQLQKFGCCEDNFIFENMNWLENEIQNRIVSSKVKLYRQLAAPITPNTQQPEAG